ncbi:hypothetical protein [Micromonospora sp. CNB394]|uniref:hypothetical protein n=1 Tax=Micromonospora sp. CNB394 TaxID=1169151 RepID=UPI00039DE14C|nr:hypothetical protein [Micromonospora sp. CNB394]
MLRVSGAWRLTDANPDNCADGFTYRLTVGPAESGYVDCGPVARQPAVTAEVVELLTRATG